MLLSRLGDFGRNALTLTGGTVIAQALPFLLYPVFTRLYGPEDFGTFAAVTTTATVLGVMASGSYEGAILLARNRVDAMNIAGLAFLRALIVILSVTLIATTGVLYWNFGDPTIWLVWCSVPLLSIFIVGVACFSELFVRERQFRDLALNRIFHSGTASLAKLLMGIGGLTAGGLVLGEVAGRCVASVAAGHTIVSRFPAHLRSLRWRRMQCARLKYRNFPRHIMPDQLISTLGGGVHVFFIGTAFGVETLGYVSVVLSVLYLPVTVVSSAIKDVFRQRAAIEIATDGNCRTTYTRLLLPLSGMAAIVFGIVYLIPEAFYTLLLGEGWGVLRSYIFVLAPMFALNFVSMSLGGILIIAGKTHVALMWQVSTLAATCLALGAGTWIFNDLLTTLVLFSAARSIAYVIYMYLSYRFAKTY